MVISCRNFVFINFSYLQNKTYEMVWLWTIQNILATYIFIGFISNYKKNHWSHSNIVKIYFLFAWNPERKLQNEKCNSHCVQYVVLYRYKVHCSRSETVEHSFTLPITWRHRGGHLMDLTSAKLPNQTGPRSPCRLCTRWTRITAAKARLSTVFLCVNLVTTARIGSLHRQAFHRVALMFQNSQNP